MSATLEIQELAIVIATQNHNPTVLTPDFLKYSGIVPADWELAQSPVCTPNVAQIVFQNGTGITAQRDRIIFSETMSAKSMADVVMPKIACQYLASLPNVEYRAVGINPRGHAVLAGGVEATNNYMTQTLLGEGDWKTVGNSPLRAAVQLSYRLERSQLNLSVTEAAIQLPEQELLPVILFSGNFNYTIAPQAAEPKHTALTQVIQGWQLDLQTFQDMINSKFLNQTTVVVDVAEAQPILPV